MKSIYLYLVVYDAMCIFVKTIQQSVERCGRYHAAAFTFHELLCYPIQAGLPQEQDNLGNVWVALGARQFRKCLSCPWSRCHLYKMYTVMTTGCFPSVILYFPHNCLNFELQASLSYKKRRCFILLAQLYC